MTAPPRHDTAIRAVIAGLLVLAACGGSSDADAPAPSTPNDGTPPAPSATESTNDTGPVQESSSDSGTTPIPPPTSLVAAPSADLPTRPPGEEPAPVTTVPGPLETPVVRLLDVATFQSPVAVTTSADDERLFIIEQGGMIIAADSESTTTALDLAGIPDVTLSRDSEQGLLGLAFHPKQDLAYINYTNGEGDTVIAEFAFDPVSATFDESSYRELMTVDQPFANHNGGHLEFGPDDLLYIGLGDGGSANDPNRSALDLSSPLGKILRIDPIATDDAAFTIPDDNPLVGVDGTDGRIWTSGLRNPWRFSFDALTGDLWIADVGQNRLEEVNLAVATNGVDAGRSVSFGWSAFEANERFNDDQPDAGHVLPVVTYAHEAGNCSVSGGVVARDSFIELNGWYVYGDYCSGTVWGLDTTSVTIGPDGPVGEPVIVELATVPALSAISEGPSGDLYAVSNAGPVYQIIPG